MPEANDGELTRLITVHAGGTVEDPAPNTPPPGVSPPETTFDLHLEAVAGNALGSSGATYTLTITALDLTAGVGQPGLSPGPLAQSFSAPNWLLSGAAVAEFVTNQTFTITIPPSPSLSGHVFIYTASLVSTNFQEAWLIQSNPFVLC
jgi:hypothetical protein